MQTLQVERSDGIVTITLDRPEKRNAVSSQMWAELQEVATELATSDDRCVVLTGAGGAFCSGADLWEADAPPATQLPRWRRVNRVFQPLHDWPKVRRAQVLNSVTYAPSRLPSLL